MFKLFYYTLYKALIKGRPNDSLAFNAMILLMTLQAFNILSLLAIINYYLKIDLTKMQSIGVSIILFIILFLLDFLFLFGKLDILKVKYNNESKSERTLRNIYFITYVLISLIIFFSVGETIVHKQY